MQQSAENEQPHCFVTAYLSGRSGQYIEHVVDSVTKDCVAKGDGETYCPEGEHGKEAVEDYGDTGKRDCYHKNFGAAGRHQERIDKASGKAFNSASYGLGEQSCHFVEEGNCDCAFPGCKADKD